MSPEITNIVMDSEVLNQLPGSVRRVGADLPVLGCRSGFRNGGYRAAKHLISGCPSFSGGDTKPRAVHVVNNGKESIPRGVRDVNTLVRKVALFR